MCVESTNKPKSTDRLTSQHWSYSCLIDHVSTELKVESTEDSVCQ